MNIARKIQVENVKKNEAASTYEVENFVNFIPIEVNVHLKPGFSHTGISLLSIFVFLQWNLNNPISV